MTSVKVRYIGAKDLKEDNVAGTGTVWLGKGDVKSVPLDAWAKMSKHTAVWELVDEDEEPPLKRTLGTAAPMAMVLAPAPLAAPIAAPVAAAGPAPAEPAAPTFILGTATHGASIDIGGKPVQLGVVVARAQSASGLTEAEWNELGEGDRDDFIATEIEVMREQADQAQADAAAEALAKAPKPTAEELAAGKPSRAARGTGKRGKAPKAEES